MLVLNDRKTLLSFILLSIMSVFYLYIVCTDLVEKNVLRSLCFR